MRILITGSKGMLGTDLGEVLAQKHEVVGIDIGDVDITDAPKLIKIMDRIEPSVVIHTAAYTDVDSCESNVDLAYKVNAIGTQNVALACQKVKAVLLYLSTDYVFDGRKGEPYIEFDTPNPLNVYGKSKLAGEWYVQTLLDRFFIVRTSWLYGKEGKNFVKTILKLATEKNELKIVNDQIGSPTYTKDLSEVMGRLIETSYYGIYHASNKGNCSWYEFAKKILEYAGMDKVRVTPITSIELNRPAQRPAYSVLKNYCLEFILGDSMRRWEEALAEFISLLKY